MSHSWAWVRLRALFALILAIFALSLVLQVTDSDKVFQVNSKDFKWLDIEPTRDLVWHPCHKETQIRECARLLVPLNHSDPDPEGPTAAIALVRKPSSYPPSSPLYRGPVLFNPGGPGGSGVDFIMAAGDLFSTILGPEFDIVGFDPRGIGRSVPKVNFFPEGGREALGMDGLTLISNDARKGGRSVEGVWARGVVKGGLAGERMGKTLEFINTEQTAGDMLSITRASGREKVLYWGFSYGTVLGAAFAALYPDKIERLVLDGVVDADDYYATLWSKNLYDTDKTLSQFFSSCHAAGPESCSFWAPSPDAIKQNLTRIYTSLQSEPVPVINAQLFSVLDYSTLRMFIFITLYSPYAMWPALAQVLAALSSRKELSSALWNPLETQLFGGPPSYDDDCGRKEQKEREMAMILPDAQTAVLCGDGKEVPKGAEAARKYFSMLREKSEWADLWANIRLGCSGWPKSEKPFQGPFRANTSFPILFIGNTADPVTPLAGAITMSRGFPGSVFLTQDSPGHCSINAPSVCTQKYIQDYFVKGVLPPYGEVCRVTTSPFPRAPGNAAVVVQGDRDTSEMVFKDVRETKLHDAVGELSKTWKPFDRAFL